VRIHEPVISMQLDPDHTGATHGVVSGILRTEELIEELRGTLGAADPSFCEGTAVEGLLNQFRQASDILHNGEQSHDEECDGISIGIGFDAKEIVIGGIAEPEIVSDPCSG
jgi:hypothetical protein